MQKLLKSQAKLHQSLLNQQSISLPQTGLNPTNNAVSLKLKADGTEWRPMFLDDTTWSVEKHRFLRVS